MTARLDGTRVLPPLENGSARRYSGTEPDEPTNRDNRLQRKAQKRWFTLNTFIDKTIRHLRAGDALLWMVLFRDARNEIAKVSQQYLADRLGICRKTVYRRIKRLRALNLVEVVKAGGFRRGPHSYRLHPEADKP